MDGYKKFYRCSQLVLNSTLSITDRRQQFEKYLCDIQFFATSNLHTNNYLTRVLWSQLDTLLVVGVLKILRITTKHIYYYFLFSKTY